jgi:hypothetical protein
VAPKVRRRLLWPLAALLAAACARPLPPPARPAVVRRPPPPAPVRLAWMPLEPRASPEIATVINEHLAGVAVAGVTERFQAPVSMEMAQLAIECIEAKPECFVAVGRKMGADKLLWAEIARVARPSGSVTLRVRLFDVAGGTVVQEGARTFPNVKAAHDGAAALVDGTFAAGAVAARSAP